MKFSEAERTASFVTTRHGIHGAPYSLDFWAVRAMAFGARSLIVSERRLPEEQVNQDRLGRLSVLARGAEVASCNNFDIDERGFKIPIPNQNRFEIVGEEIVTAAVALNHTTSSAPWLDRGARSHMDDREIIRRHAVLDVRDELARIAGVNGYYTIDGQVAI